MCPTASGTSVARFTFGHGFHAELGQVLGLSQFRHPFVRTGVISSRRCPPSRTGTQRLADADCPVTQVEERALHGMVGVDDKIGLQNRHRRRPIMTTPRYGRRRHEDLAALKMAPSPGIELRARLARCGRVGAGTPS
jgi:hypothetical protein